MARVAHKKPAASRPSRKKPGATRKKSTASRKQIPARKKSVGAKKTGSRKKATAGRKSAASKRIGAKKTAVKRSAIKRTAAKKSGGRKYGRKASSQVGDEIREMKAGKLRSGSSGKKVTDRKQAIAIGLSKARRGGAKVPAQPGGRKKSK